MAFSITLLYAGLLALILLALSMRVVALRRRHKVGIGSGDHVDLELAVRCHANFCEYVPLALLLLLALEASGSVAAGLLHGLGLGLVLGRVLHGFLGLNRSAGTTQGRFIGTLLTWLMLTVAALMAVWIGLGRWILGLG
jgi:uncharacterized protein